MKEKITKPHANWRTEQGEGPCSKCPAHWSRHPDLDTSPDKRSSSLGIAPFYGIGERKSPDVAIIAEGPGPIRDDINSDRDYTQQSLEQRLDRYTLLEDAFSGSRTLDNAKPLVNKLLDEGLSVYFTQMRKCNQVGSSSSDKTCEANKLCYGGKGSGYLADEIEAVSPEMIITMGEKSFDALLDIYDVNSNSMRNFTLRAVADLLNPGGYKSGIQIAKTDNQKFDIIPVLHPGQAWSNVKRLKEYKKENFYTYDVFSEEDGDKKATYYKQVGEDFQDLFSS